MQSLPKWAYAAHILYMLSHMCSPLEAFTNSIFKSGNYFQIDSLSRAQPRNATFSQSSSSWVSQAVLPVKNYLGYYQAQNRPGLKILLNTFWCCFLPLKNKKGISIQTNLHWSLFPFCKEIGMNCALIFKSKVVHCQNFKYLESTTDSKHTKSISRLPYSREWPNINLSTAWSLLPCWFLELLLPQRAFHHFPAFAEVHGWY